MGFFEVLTLLLIYLKLTVRADLSWWAVSAPLAVMYLIIVLRLVFKVK